MAPIKERPATKPIATNRQARHEYFVIEALETGIELKGTEVKSLRAGGVNLKDSWVDIDGGELRARYPLVQRFTVEGTDVLMKHIGGYPGRYDRSVKDMLTARPPKLFVSGHSHILKVMYDKHLGTLHINPGAAGQYGFHKVRTIVRFVIDGTDIKDLEIMEMP